MTLVIDTRSKELPDKNVEEWRAFVRDSDNEGLIGIFIYYLYPREARLPPFLDLLMLQTGWDPARSAAGESRTRLTANRLRDLPLVRWERAARIAIMDRVEKVLPLLGDDDLNTQVGKFVREQWPEFDELSNTPAGRRRQASLVRLGRTAIEYRQFVSEGRSDPANEIANRHTVAPATARSWIYRARQAGLIGEAMTGTAGEMDSFEELPPELLEPPSIDSAIDEALATVFDKVYDKPRTPQEGTGGET